jgi:hypothetical protein
MNPVRNEYEISVGGEVILLRPTFQNIAAMENAVGGLNYLAWKFSRGSIGKQINVERLVKDLPYMTELAQVIFYNQAEKKFTLEQIWELVKAEGADLTIPVSKFLGRITAGSNRTVEGLDDAEKKSI